MTITAGTPDCGMSVEAGRWHRLVCHESGTVIFEAKDGAYEPIVALGQHYEEFIQANIAGGRYNNASEVVRAALRRLEEDEARIAAFCAAVDEGGASPDVLDCDEEAFIQELKKGWRVFGTN